MKKTLGTLLIIFSALASGLGLSCQESYPSPSESIIISYAPFESTALLWIAEDQNLFRRNGITITLRKYDTGASALEGIIKGEADIAVGIAEFPLVGKAFRKESIRIIGNIDKAEFIYLVARKDRGISKVTDLKGKRVGTTLGTVAHFHLGMLLNLHGMNMKDITLIDVKTPEEWVNAVVDGSIDAVVTAQPYANYARDRLGANAFVQSAQNSQFLYGLLIANNKWITNHSDLVSRFLKSLTQAEEFLKNHPTEAKFTVQNRVNLDTAYTETAWTKNQFALSLDQSLILIMEDEARWMISNNLTTERTIPNFLEFIDADGLRAVKSGAVRISGK